MLFIIGMVIAPSTTTLATALPETVPNSADETTETLAGRRDSGPWHERDIGEKFIAADGVKRLAKKINATTMPAATSRGKPKMPLESRYR